MGKNSLSGIAAVYSVTKETTEEEIMAMAKDAMVSFRLTAEEAVEIAEALERWVASAKKRSKPGGAKKVRLKDLPAKPAKCRDCGKPVASDVTRCLACHRKHLAAKRVLRKGVLKAFGVAVKKPRDLMDAPWYFQGGAPGTGKKR